MAELALGVTQTLFAVFQCSELKALCSVWYYKTQLNELKQTVTTIKNVFDDVETVLLSKEERGYIKELREVLYEADDLFDEFLTHLELMKLKRSRIFKKVSQAFRMFKKANEIKTKLSFIVYNHKNFPINVKDKPICLRGFPINVKDEPICLRGEETCSYVDVKGIIGRDDDKKAVIEMLLESKNQDFVFMTIVGVGGLGKTALAQFVYNDEDVEREFGNNRFWVCVSDQDQQRFDVKVILSKILKLVTEGQKSDPKDQKLDTKDAFELEQLQKEFQKKLSGKKYMLVLDDVWNEDRAKWVDFEKFLKLGAWGSRVLVTTRSEKTAMAVVGSNDHIYRLKGLSPEITWDLFKMVAFNEESYQQKEFLEVGEKIVAKCYNIPLAIKVVGSLLYGQPIKKWNSFEETALSKIEKGENLIMSVLKLSYYNLKPSLKSCFTYCALFPKDYIIWKDKLIHLWMAQGYIVPNDQGGQSIADVAEEYFLILLQRCFFQDVERDKDGDVMIFKIHDLMHDVAQEMAAEEIQVGGNNIGDEVLHWSYYVENGSPISSVTTKLRSYLCLTLPQVSGSSQLVPKQLKRVRALELKHIDDTKSLESIGKLLHLRYLFLNDSKFRALPTSLITKLLNLQTFMIHNCFQLRELPHDFSKLKNLVHIQIFACPHLDTMPSLSKLLYLKSLSLNILKRLVYMEKPSSFAGAEDTPFFPSLEWLCISEVNNLKGWFDPEVSHCQSIRGFPCLSRLEIRNCIELETFPPCPRLKTLMSDNLGIVKQVIGNGNDTSCLATLILDSYTSNEDDIIPWKAFNQSLRTLVIHNFTLESFPEGMQHLTSLQTLKILSCLNLNAIPEWISCLTSLQDLQIRQCSEILCERCERSGADWPNIQRIPNNPKITISRTYASFHHLW